MMPRIAVGPKRDHGLQRRTAWQSAGNFADEHRSVLRQLVHPRERPCACLHENELDRSRRGPRLRAALMSGGVSVAESVLAAVRVAPSKTEIREYPMPDIPDDAALMKMEVAGICGTDVKLYKTPPTKSPVIMGHENIGTIAKAGREFTRRKGFKEGDLVFVEHYVACGKCEWCHVGREGPASVGWLCPLRLSSLERGRASCAEGRHAGIGRIGDPDGERGGMVPVRRRRR